MLSSIANQNAKKNAKEHSSEKLTEITLSIWDESNNKDWLISVNDTRKCSFLLIYNILYLADD